MAYIDLRCTTSTPNVRKNGRVRINYTAGNGTVKITSIQGYRTDGYRSYGNSSSNRITVVVGGVSSGSVGCSMIDFGANSSPRNWSAFSKTYSGLNGNVTITLTVNSCNNSDISGSVWTGTVNAGSAMVTISYNANGGSNAPSAQTVEQGKQVNLSSTIPYKENELSKGYTITLNANGGYVSTSELTQYNTTSYSFKSWNTNSSGTGTTYNPGGSYTANTDVTLYAIWNTNITKGSVTLPTPARAHYSFVGWGTTASATTGVIGTITPTSSQTLYAVWERTPSLVNWRDSAGNFMSGGTISVKDSNGKWVVISKIKLKNGSGVWEEH